MRSRVLGITMATVEITPSYSGRRSDQNEIDLYDIGQALIGFQRSLALTTHLILNDKIITQAPSLDGAQILALPAAEGSWKLTAAVLVTLWTIGTAPKDSPLGHLISSAYDYVISETLGFHVDYNKTLGQQYEQFKGRDSAIKRLPQSRFDSLIEKCETAVREMHRPISKSETATVANLSARVGEADYGIGRPLTYETYEYIAFTERSLDVFEYVGRVSSYNINTFKGRIYVETEGRPIPFELADTAKGARNILAVTSSLRANSQKNRTDEADINFNAFRNVSRSGRLKSFLITEVSR
jgi:hypothetical protein